MNMMFRRQVTGSPKEIAHGVSMTREHIEAEERFRAAMVALDAARAEASKVRASARSLEDPAVSAAIQATTAAEALVNEAHRPLPALREIHGRHVADALAPIRAAAAARIAAALEAIQDDVDMITETTDVLARHKVTVLRMPPHWTDTIVATAKRIADMPLATRIPRRS